MAHDERLAFSFGQPAVPQRPAPARHREDESFATAAHSEPRDWGYTGLVAFTVVLLLRPQDYIPALGPLHLAEVFALVGIGPMLIHRFTRRLPVFRIRVETAALLAFGGVMLAVAPFSIWPGGSVREVFDTYLKIVVVFVLMVNTLTTPRRIQRFTWVVLLCCGAVAGRAVLDYVRGVNLVEGGRLAGPVGGIFGNPNDLALNMVTFMPVAAVAAMTRRHTAVVRLVAVGIFAAMLLTVVFTQSRSGALGLGAMLLALVVLTRTVRPAFGVGLVAAVLIAAPFLPSSFWTRMSSIFDQQEDARDFTGSRETRTVVMQEGIHTFLVHPFTGVGMGQFENYNYPGRQEKWRQAHNVLIQVAADTGIFGLALFVLLLVRAAITAASLRRALRDRRRRPVAAARALAPDDRHTLHELGIALGAGLVGWFVCALFASVAYSWTFYYVLALLVASREVVRDRVAAVTGNTPQRLRAVGAGLPGGGHAELTPA